MCDVKIRIISIHLMLGIHFRMFWESKNFEGCTDSVEPWYGTSYSVEKVTVSTIKVQFNDF